MSDATSKHDPEIQPDSQPAPNAGSQPEVPDISDSTLLWTLLEEVATTQSYLEVILRNQALMRAKLEQRQSEEILDEMEIDQAKVFTFLWPKVIEGMMGKRKRFDKGEEEDITEYPNIGS